MWLPGAEVIPGRDGGGFIGAPWRGVLHTTEGSTAQSAIDTVFVPRGFWPHLTIEWREHQPRVVQHLPLDVAARALEHHTVQTNQANCIQIEIAGFAAQTPNWTAEQLEFVAGVMRAVEALVPIPRRSGLPFKTFPESFGLHNGVRLNAADWLAFSGWCGHQHVPEQTHGDPGAIDIGYLCSPRLLGVGSSQSSPGPATVARTPYSLDVILSRPDRPYAQGWQGDWDGFSQAVGDGSVPPTTAVGVCAAARRHDVVDVFWVGADGSLHTAWWTRSTGWAPTVLRIGDPSVPATTSGGVAAVARQPGILDVFFIGQDDHLHTTWWSGAWSPASPAIGGTFTADPTGGIAAVNRRRDVLDVFAVGQDGLLYTTWWTEQTGWAPTSIPIGGTGVAVNPVSGCAAVAREPGSLDVVYIGTDLALYAVSWRESEARWAGPVRIGGPAAPPASGVAGPAVVSRRPDVIDVFWIGQDQRLHNTWWTQAGGWHPGSTLLGDPGITLSPVGTPAAVARDPNILDVFVADINGQVHTTWWTDAGGWNPGFRLLDV